MAHPLAHSKLKSPYERYASWVTRKPDPVVVDSDIALSSQSLAMPSPTASSRSGGATSSGGQPVRSHPLFLNATDRCVTSWNPQHVCQQSRTRPEDVTGTHVGKKRNWNRFLVSLEPRVGYGPLPVACAPPQAWKKCKVYVREDALVEHLIGFVSEHPGDRPYFRVHNAQTGVNYPRQTRVFDAIGTSSPTVAISPALWNM